MTVWEAIIIGLIQGLTEFLPVSSSGHIILAERILGVQSELSFALILHLATLLAVVIVMRKEIWECARTPKKWGPLAVATIFSAIVVFAFNDLFKLAFDGRYLSTCFLITAVMLLFSGLVKPKKQEITCFDAVIIGCVQGFAAMPGISRSGSTVSTSILLGNERSTSVSFSFLLSIPIIVGSALIDLISEGLGSIQFLPLLFGFISAFISGLGAIKLMLKLTSNACDWFAIYLTALSVFLIVNDLFLHLF
ncbi:MAG: undecaprenyl-diphosphate phosphatase [Clostridiales bacterium]|nr:undecaprenyl-diphosphate phosphatase [Clostridiales bacterium]